jgi:hypothetical protein
MQFLTCLDCKIQADDVNFRYKAKGFARPHRTPRCDACVHKKQMFRRHSDNQYLIDRQPHMIEKKMERKQKIEEQTKEQIKSQKAKDRVIKALAYRLRATSSTPTPSCAVGGVLCHHARGGRHRVRSGCFHIEREHANGGD